MEAPSVIAAAARARVRAAATEIEHSLKSINEGRPGDAETDQSRRAAVVQARQRIPLDEARQVARKIGPEAIWGKTIDFVDVVFFERGARAARSVCRIITRSGQAIGSGFLISPRLLITNNHVISSETAARGMFAEFEYERDIGGMPRQVTRFALAPEVIFLTDDRDDLDFSVLAVGARAAGAKDLSAFGYLPLSGARNKHALGDFVNIIQHPNGRMKEAVVRENQLVSRPKTGTVLHYVADTEPGSSGSPVFNVLWNVVALHHWGGPHRELFDDKGLRVPRTVNEGIRASAIATDLETRKVSLTGTKRALVEEALMLGVEDPSPSGAGLPPESASGAPPAQSLSGPSMSIAPDGTATWQVPVSFSVRVGWLPPAAALVREPSGMGQPAPAEVIATGSEARLELDEDYENRSGYDPDFLRDVSIPLPELSVAQKRVAAKNRERRRGDDPYQLRYEHFSVVMNGARRLAFFTATNIDGTHAKDFDRKTGKITDASGITGEDDGGDEGAEAAELWFEERRLKENEYTPPDFYADQWTFDASGRKIHDRRSSAHRNRMFQQGHLTRRQDPLWGSDEIVYRANVDTFHVTNRAPQIGYFNMGTKKENAEAKKHPGGNLHWRALEDYVLANARADHKRVTVFTGPIFDDENDIPWSRGRDDMKGFKAPREFWKVVLRIENGRLHATALVADQSPLINYVPELLELPANEARRVGFEKVAKYQVSIPELQSRTGLDFGPDLRASDTFRRARNEQHGRRAVESIEDISFGRPSRQGAAARRHRAPRAARGPAAKRRRNIGKRSTT